VKISAENRNSASKVEEKFFGRKVCIWLEGAFGDRENENFGGKSKFGFDSGKKSWKKFFWLKTEKSTSRPLRVRGRVENPAENQV